MRVVCEIKNLQPAEPYYFRRTKRAVYVEHLAPVFMLVYILDRVASDDIYKSPDILFGRNVSSSIQHDYTFYPPGNNFPALNTSRNITSQFSL